ncbi:MAG TPA: HAMP domain-containing sensor histidine kinase [Longimicrobiales bacterium]
MRVPLLAALLLLLAAALAAALVPAGLALDRRIEAELRRTAVDDLGRAPMILEDRNAQRDEALSMHAMTVAGSEGLARAVEEGRFQDAAAMAGQAAGMYGEDPVIVLPDGVPVVGPAMAPPILESVRSGGSRVEYVQDGDVPRVVGLAPLRSGDVWLGAAGSSTPLDGAMATTLSSLARADVTILGRDGALVASTLDPAQASLLAGAATSAGGRDVTDKVREVAVAGAATWIAAAPVADAGTVLFSRTVAEELAALPGMRREALLAGLLTLVLALGVGFLVAATLARPVRGLAEAASRVSEGDFEAPIPVSRVEEVDRLGTAFRIMRESLRRRLGELADANRELEDRQRRLAELQTELIRQDRLASSARMAAELAHEIRNPVANVRNCLEVVRRGLPDGWEEGARFADMAIDELLRMHELAEQLLDLNRPGDPGAGDCDPAEVAGQVATLAGVGDNAMEVAVRTTGGVGAAAQQAVRAALPPDALKQILFNLVENAREASGGSEPVEVEITTAGSNLVLDVLDRGRGLSDDVIDRLFDPFFTTKDAVTGVGLGLFVAEGLTRRYGGRIEAANRADGPGARFRIQVPAAAGGRAAPVEDAASEDAEGGAS